MQDIASLCLLYLVSRTPLHVQEDSTSGEDTSNATECTQQLKGKPSTLSNSVPLATIRQIFWTCEEREVSFLPLTENWRAVETVITVLLLSHCAPHRKNLQLFCYFSRNTDSFSSWLYPGGTAPGVLPARAGLGRVKASSSLGADRRQRLLLSKEYEEQWNIQGKIHPG